MVQFPALEGEKVNKLQKTYQADFCVFEINLVYIEGSMPAMVT